MPRIVSPIRVAVVGLSTAAFVLGAALPAAAAPITSATKVVAATPTANERVGYSVAVSADDTIAMIGSELSAYNSGSAPSTVRVYTSSGPGTAWTASQQLSASDATNSDQFGTAVALSDDGTTAVISAEPFANGHLASGQVYVFTRTGSTWTQVQEILAAGTGAGSFGSSIDISADGKNFVVGSPCDDSSCVGAAYFYSKAGGASTWTQTSKITCAGAASSLCGGAVAISGSGSVAAVGDPSYNYQSGTKTIRHPTVYTYKNLGSSWSYQAAIPAPTPDGASTSFGYYDTLTLSSNGTSLVIGAPGQTTLNSTYIAGAVYTYLYSGSSWGNLTTFTVNADNDFKQHQFGYSVDMSANGLKLVVGEPKGTTTTAAGGGIAYYLTRPTLSSAWTIAASYQSADLAASDQFGASVALPATTGQPVIGAPFKPAGSTAGAGAAYIY